MWWNPVFILLIIFSTTVDFFIGKKIYNSTNSKAWLIASLSANLGLLAFFKYAGFFQENLLFGLRVMGIEPSWTSINVVLPIGISFFTFQTLSYSIDVYRKQIIPTTDPLDFAVFVSFFPQLVAGPIIRASEFLPQLQKERRLVFSKYNLILICKGLFKKVIIADNLAFLVDRIFENPALYPSTFIILAALCFTIQIYCDFSGYTDIAIGVAGILGFQFPDNFNKPYFARTPSEFWKRWHMTLSRWLRDYLYIPLGGNQHGKLFTLRNLLITMILGGLWHGASWNFLLWGLVHGMLLIGYRIGNLGSKIENLKFASLSSWLSLFVFQYLVVLTWIIFRIKDPNQMLLALRKFILLDFDFDFTSLSVGTMQLFSNLILVLVFVFLHVYSFRVKGVEYKLEQYSWGLLFALLSVGIFTSYFFIPLQEQPFIYFQF